MSQPPMRFKPSDFDSFTWGQLLKAWAKGDKPKPATLQELADQMVEAGMTRPTFPPHLTTVTFVQSAKTVLTINLPNKEMLAEGEATIEQAGAYPLPHFYDKFYVNPQRRTDLLSAEKKQLHGARVGEYSINSCK